jgi:hypothetical protein
MSESARVWCCRLCGRWGTRQFRPADDGVEGCVCTNDRACWQRAKRLVTC